MRFERGPFGKIAVKTVASEADVILHALDVLQNHVISSILPVYLREQMGKIQLCIDCTGYVQLSEIKENEWENQCQKRTCIAEFIQVIINAQDHFMESGLFVMDSEYVFFDPMCKTLYWCCLPIFQNGASSNSDPCSPVWDKFELLLMNPFFAEVLEEDDRNQLLCLFRNEREDDVKKFLDSFVLNKGAGKKSRPQTGWRMIRLLIQFFLMGVSFAACIYLENYKPGVFQGRNWASWYVIFFAFTLVISLMFGHGKKTESFSSSGISENESAKSLTRKEMYFPSAGDIEKTYSTDAHTSLFSPAFLTQQITHTGKGSKPLRSVVWVDDFLIGRDKSLCDFFIDETSISDRHARILHREPMYYLMDLGSAAGTWIGSRRLYSFEETPLSDGDIFICGDIRFVFNNTH